MCEERKPLATRNKVATKLPLPGSRLKPPQSYKRARSPDDEEELEVLISKKSRLEESGVLNVSEKSAQLSRDCFTSSLPETCPSSTMKAPSTHKTSASSRIMRPPVTGRTGTAKRPGQVLKPATTVSRMPSGSRLAANTTLETTRLSKAASVGNLKKVTTQSAAPAKKEPSAMGKKRQPWDLKGRLEDMEGMMKTRESAAQLLHAQLESYNQRIQQLECQKQALSGDIVKHSERAQLVGQENRDLQKQLRECQAETETTRRNLQNDIDNLNFSMSTLQRQKATLEGELTAAGAEIAGLKTSISQLTSANAGISAELESTKLNLEQALRDLRKRDATLVELKATLAQREATVQENEKTIREHETMRRKLHNTIQELKGNIRVFCRVRPLIGEEQMFSDGVINHINFPDPENKIIELDRMTEMSINESTMTNLRRSANNKYEFCFDRVFSPENTQAEVFEEISQLVQSALDGYNVCIFAYGQTGSGKTYTMEGRLDCLESVGMIPRCVSQIFQNAADLHSKGWQYKFSASFVEIYNETIGDLLDTKKDKSIKHEIRMTGKSSTVSVTNLTTVDVTDEQQIARLLRQASENRAVAATKCNERSSRSHSIFMMNLEGSNSITGEVCQGTLNLVDLAGSERLKESGSEGQRLKETQAINRSLSHLGNVIMALGNKEQHVPYRDSKLTYLLQNSLGGNSKTLMFVNVSPKEDNFSETLNSLRFAVKVNQCNIGTAQKRTK